MDTTNIIRIAFLNIHGQTKLDLSKQLQIEKFILMHNLDVLNCQETNLVEGTFSQCYSVNSSYEIIKDYAANKYLFVCQK